MTHPNDAPCPFATAKPPVGSINTCCSFNTKVAAENLSLLGHDPLARLLHVELSTEKVPYMVRELRRFAEAVEGQYVEPTDTPDGSRPAGVIDSVTNTFTPWARPAFDRALTTIRQAADWYEKVGRLGFDVHVLS